MDNAAIWAAAEQQRAQVMAFGREPAPLKQYVRLLKQKLATEQKKAAKAAEAEAARAAMPPDEANEAAAREEARRRKLARQAQQARARCQAERCEAEQQLAFVSQVRRES